VRGAEATTVVIDEPTVRADPVDARRRQLRERLRAEWIAGAEAEWRRRLGRPMTAAELERVLKRYPGDL
jgi:hypothetical protein